MSELSHTLMDGKVHVYRRPESRFWQCSVYLGGRNHRASTGHDNLAVAMEFARDWYMDRYADERLRARGIALPEHAPPPPLGTPLKAPAANPARGPTFQEVADRFLADYQVMTQGERNAVYVANKVRHVKKYLGPFFGARPVGDVSSGLIQAYRVHRLSSEEGARRPARSTFNQEIVTLRQILKAANRNGLISALPDMSAPYRASGKVSHRAWFSPEEYKRLYEATRERARNPRNERWRGECEQFHDYVLFMVNTGLRPDEASRLQFRDVVVAMDEATGERILEIEVRGKRGVGYCKSMPGAVHPFNRVNIRKKPAQTDLVFGPVQRELLNTVLSEIGLKRDRDGRLRTAYSLRHTYICMRLMEGADIYQIAKNCRTSVEMIEKFYAAHIKNTLDAAAINVRKVSQRKMPSAAPRGRTPKRKSANAVKK